MKKRIHCLTLIISLMLPIAAWARTITSDVLVFEVISESDRTCRVTGLTRNASSYRLVIPYSVTDGSTGSDFTITEVGESAFEGLKIDAMEIERGSTPLYFAHDALKSAELRSLTVARDFWSNVNDEPFYALGSLETLLLGEGLTRVPAFSFAKTMIKSVNLPSTVESIGFGAFQCTNLVSVKFADGGSLTSIGGEAFWDCRSLTSSIGFLPEGLTSIGESAFANTAIGWVYLPSTLTYIGRNAFAGCTRLSQVMMAPGNSSYSYADGFLMNVDRTVVYQYIGTQKSAMVPDGVTTIANSAFWSSQIQTLSLPSTVTLIDDNAFYFCRELSDVVLPDGLKTIGKDAFAYCTSLKSIALPDGLTEMRSGCFKCCGLTSIAFPPSLHYIPAKAFSRTNLESVEIPESVDRVGASAFEACASLTSVKFGTSWNTVKVLEASLFKDCHKLTEVTFPAFLEEIGESAFSGCVALTEVLLPGTTKKIGSAAFDEAGLITSVSVSAATPPSLQMNSFITDVYRNATLNVPVGCAEGYKKAHAWQLFTTIEESGELSGAQTIEIDPADDTVTVYGLDGVKVYEGLRSAMPLLPAGIYVVGGRKVRF